MASLGLSSAPEAWQVGFLPYGPQAGSAVERSLSVWVQRGRKWEH